MKRHVLLVSAVLLTMALMPPAASAGTVAATVGEMFFSPMPVVATTGDTVTWTNVGNYNHTVTAFYNATFDSGELSPGQSFSIANYSGEIIDYRCTIHSWYEEEGGHGFSPGYYGMVGKIKTPPPTVAITSPSDGATVTSPVAVSGTASDDVAVTKVTLVVTDPLGGKKTFLATCSGCNTPTVSWSGSVPAGVVFLPVPGPYDITAYAYDGNGSATAQTISVFVSPIPLQ